MAARVGRPETPGAAFGSHRLQNLNLRPLPPMFHGRLDSTVTHIHFSTPCWDELMAPSRCFFNIFADDLEATRSFYVELFGFRDLFVSDWFVNLGVPEHPALELGISRRDHDIVPDAGAGLPRGAARGMITLVVPDVDGVFDRARTVGYRVVEPPRDLFYGQRRLVLEDPAGTWVDVSSECEPDPDWLARVEQTDDGTYREI